MEGATETIVNIDTTEIVMWLETIHEQNITTNTFLALIVGFLFAFAFFAFTFMRK